MNRDTPAHPMTLSDGTTSPGMTKLELAAMNIYCAMLSRPEFWQINVALNTTMAEAAVKKGSLPV